ncbi:HEAT repeat domain-containing protein [Methanogenium sp. S4BF]|uniref:HEAT repeat domain-containing protein n=1 Tax=Methanogenium sp. S4BF TaxID=1789226 RepID=UPI0024171258|nr:HEAT repeat domain-containing protein [Methanogenium sp. S4BF]WFN35077.1 HEAT repeat domain-containing protein [Methanogenium sp. S4BF]
MTGCDDPVYRVYAERERRRDENARILIRQLTEDGISYRVRAAEALGTCGGDVVVPHLIRAAEDDPEPDVRFMAIRSLGKRRDPLAAEPLIRMLAIGDKWIRMEAVKALGDIGHPSAALSLMNLCDDTAVPVRRAVAEALGKIECEACMSALEMMTNDEDSGVRSAARRALSSHRHDDNPQEK